MASNVSRNIGKRIRWISNSDQHGLRSSAHDSWNDIAINRGILFQKPQSPLRIAPVGCPAGLFVYAGRDQHHAGAVQCIVITIGNIDPWTEWYPITQVGRYGFRHLSRSVHENDLASTTARRGRERDGVSNVACADDAELHCSAPVLTHRCRNRGCRDTFYPVGKTHNAVFPQHLQPIPAHIGQDRLDYGGAARARN
jgi:hypothetical protein